MQSSARTLICNKTNCLEIENSADCKLFIRKSDANRQFSLQHTLKFSEKVAAGVWPRDPCARVHYRCWNNGFAPLYNWNHEFTSSTRPCTRKATRRRRAKTRRHYHSRYRQRETPTS